MNAAETFECGACGERTSVTHWSWRTGVGVHDPDLAFREVIGLDEVPLDPDANGASS